jgi:hypothetical protein
MQFQVRVQYRTQTGEYLTADCNMDQETVHLANDYVQLWALNRLPLGSHIVSVTMGWASLPPDEVVLRRLNLSIDPQNMCQSSYK